jgi:hypothetical protein
MNADGTGQMQLTSAEARQFTSGPDGAQQEGEERVRAAYGDEHYARLMELKRKYDPGNAFKNNQNIRPAARSA